MKGKDALASETDVLRGLAEGPGRAAQQLKVSVQLCIRQSLSVSEIPEPHSVLGCAGGQFWVRQ